MPMHKICQIGLITPVMAVGGVLIPALAWAQTRGGYVPGSHDGWHGGGMMGGLMMGGGFIMMILFIAVIAVVIALVVRWIGGTGHAGKRNAAGSSGPDAIDILRERFARGDIDAAEFEERKRLLAE